MNSSVLALVVIGQIVIFQFAAVAFTRSLFAALLGQAPEPVATESATYLGRVSRHRFILGAGLLLFALASLIGIPAEPTARKLLLAVVSLSSSGAFAFAWANDRRAVRSLRDALPESGVRRASLQPRAVAHWYHAAWEALPIAILLVTVVLTIMLGRQAGQFTTRMWVMQILQIAFVIGALVHTVRHGVAVPNVSSRLPMFRDRPELALEFGERLAARDMQYFMLVKIGVTLLLGLGTVRGALGALEHTAVPMLDTAKWVVVGLLLAFFAAYLLHMVMLIKRVQGQIHPHGHEADGRS